MILFQCEDETTQPEQCSFKSCSEDNEKHKVDKVIHTYLCWKLYTNNFVHVGKNLHIYQVITYICR